MAERMAKARRVNLSTVVSEVIDEGLRSKLAAERSAKVLESYRRAFSSFDEEELMLLNGIVLKDSSG